MGASSGACKRHPNHKQAPGVCSSCLRERLSQLSNANSYSKTAATIAAYSYSSSESSSPGRYSSSRAKWTSRHHRNASDVMDAYNMMSSGGESGRHGGLMKSRSMAFVPRGRLGEPKGEKKKYGFWSKLLHLKGKRVNKEVVKHFRGYRERLD